MAAVVDLIAVTVVIMAAPAIAAVITVAKIFYNLSAVPLGTSCGRLAGRFSLLHNNQKLISLL
jgi:hypothetical protein